MNNNKTNITGYVMNQLYQRLVAAGFAVPELQVRELLTAALGEDGCARLARPIPAKRVKSAKANKPRKFEVYGCYAGREDHAYSAKYTARTALEAVMMAIDDERVSDNDDCDAYARLYSSRVHIWGVLDSKGNCNLGSKVIDECESVRLGDSIPNVLSALNTLSRKTTLSPELQVIHLWLQRVCDRDDFDERLEALHEEEADPWSATDGTIVEGSEICPSYALQQTCDFLIDHFGGAAGLEKHSVRLAMSVYYLSNAVDDFANALDTVEYGLAEAALPV